MDSLRKVREEARDAAASRPQPTRPADADVASVTGAPLPPLRHEAVEPLASPDRDELNASWNIADGGASSARGLARLLSPLRAPLRRIVRFALGPAVERQVGFNSAQVRFDNDLVRYVDDRLDRMTRHYDSVLGAHGKRMEEIDERHLILQQELIRHVHDLVERIEFVFESAEQNHLYLEGVLRETRDEVRELRSRLDRMARTPEPDDDR